MHFLFLIVEMVLVIAVILKRNYHPDGAKECGSNAKRNRSGNVGHNEASDKAEYRNPPDDVTGVFFVEFHGKDGGMMVYLTPVHSRMLGPGLITRKAKG